MRCQPGRRYTRRGRTLLALLLAGCTQEQCEELSTDRDRLKCGSDLVQVGGDAQEVQVGSALRDELVVQARRTAGSAMCSEEPRPNEPIRWVIVTGGGTVSSGTTITDSRGEARIRWTLGTTEGVQRVTAQWVDQTPNAPGPLATTTFNAVGLSAPYYVVRKYAGDGQTGPALARVTVPPEVLVVTMRDAGPELPKRETLMTNALIKYEVVTGGGTVDAIPIGTGSHGRAARDWVLGPVAGPQTLSAGFLLLGTVGPRDTVSVTFTANAVVEPVRSVVLSPDTDLTIRIGNSEQITARTFTGTPLVEAPGRSVSFSSSNDAVATVAPNAGPSPTIVRILAQAVGTARITATSEGISASINVTVTPAPPQAARIAYGVAHNGSATSPYAASLAYNSSGGAITVSHDSTGAYRVTIAGQRAPAGESETILISGYGPGNHFCFLARDWSTVGNDVVVDIRCASRALFNSRGDAPFTVMLLGSGAVPGRFGFAYADQPRASGPYTPAKSFNSGGLNPPPVSISRTGVGNYLVTFLGNGGGVNDAEALHVTAAIGGVSPEVQRPRCNISSFTAATATAHVRCYDGFAGGALQDTPFSITLLDRGRPGFRAGVAWAVDQFGEELESSYDVLLLEPRVAYSSPAGLGGVTLERRDVGQFEVLFNGIAAVDKSPVFGVQVADRDEDDPMYCNVVRWQIEGNNLRVTVNCYHEDGEPEDEGFYLLVIQ